VPVPDRVVPHPARGYAGRLRRVRCLPAVLVVGSLQDHRQRSAEVRVDDLHVRIAGRDAVRDQVHDRDRVLDWRADHPGQVVVADQRRAGAVARWVQVQHRAPAVQLGEDRLVLGLDQRAPQDGGVHRHPGHAQLVKSPAHFADGLVEVRHRQRGEGAEAVSAALDQFGVLVVDEPGRPGRLLPILAVRQLRTRRQHLHLDPGPVHQPQPGIQLGAVAGPDAARRARVGLAQVH
jgi:hypothetical protein